MEYRVIRSDRKTVALQINAQGEVILRCPRRMEDGQITAFLRRHEGWIRKHCKPVEAVEPFSASELEEILRKAQVILPQRVAFWAQRIGVRYGRITIRRQKTRWGSCSSKGNLNFNCTLVLAPQAVMDYVIIHELCHRKEMNHSPRFWAEVEKYCPDHKNCRSWLKANSQKLIGRL